VPLMCVMCVFIVVVATWRCEVCAAAGIVAVAAAVAAAVAVAVDVAVAVAAASACCVLFVV